MVENVLARHDAIVYPSVQVPPPTLAGRKDWTTLTLPTNTLIASQTWLPAITVPAGFTPEGAPVGLEFVGRPYAEATLFRLAHAYEQATRHRHGRLQPVRPLERDPERERGRDHQHDHAPDRTPASPAPACARSSCRRRRR